jgi:hypothetical protein
MIQIDHVAMFIGHYGAAEFLLWLNKTIPVLPVAIGVAYADLLWPFLVYLKKEIVTIDPKTPLQKTIDFIAYPYSHSLVRSALLTLIPSAVVALLYGRTIVGVFFYIAAMSHWFLDTLMHLPDLPVLGFGKDRKVGLGLWRYPKTAFAFEYAFFALATLLFAPIHLWAALLAGGVVLHLINANSFFGFTHDNPTKTSNAYASLALFGFGLAITGFTLVWHP